MTSNPTSRYQSLVRESLAQRRNTSLPRIGWLTAALVIFVVFYILLALVTVPEDASPAFNFRSERGTITALSAIFLGMGGGFAFASFFMSQDPNNRQRYFWLLMAMAMGFLSLDELIGFHEDLGRYIEYRTASNAAPLGIFRNWNDVVVISYGIPALFLMIYFLPSLLRYPRVFEIFVIAFSFYVIHTFFDATQEPPTTYSYIFEESAKLFCSAFLALGTFVGLVGTVYSKPSDPA